jgi:hypothetical protein
MLDMPITAEPVTPTSVLDSWEAAPRGLRRPFQELGALVERELAPWARSDADMVFLCRELADRLSRLMGIEPDSDALIDEAVARYASDGGQSSGGQPS